MVKSIPILSFFTVFLKNRNIISKIKRSKVTDYAALNGISDYSFRDLYGASDEFNMSMSAMICGFHQCGILTSIDSDKLVQPTFKFRNPK